MCKSRSGLTGNGSQDIRDEDLHEGLVHEMVAGAHPFEHDLVSAQRHQLGTGQSRFNLGDAAEKQNKTATMKKKQKKKHI